MELHWVLQVKQESKAFLYHCVCCLSFLLYCVLVFRSEIITASSRIWKKQCQPAEISVSNIHAFMSKLYMQQHFIYVVFGLWFANTDYLFSTTDPSCGALQLWSIIRPGKAWELPCGSRRAQMSCWPCWKLTGCSKLLHTFPSSAKSSCRSTLYVCST